MAARGSSGPRMFGRNDHYLRSAEASLADLPLLRDADRALCCLRNAPAERRTTSENCRSCLARGLVLRQTMPMVREGCGFLKLVTDTDAERVSTATAISGIKVTPMPALTI